MSYYLNSVSSLTIKAQRNTNSYVRRHLGSFWFHLGPLDPRLKQVSRLFPDRVKPLLQIYWMVEATVKWGPDSTCLLCSTFPGSAQDNTGWIKQGKRVGYCQTTLSVFLCLPSTAMLLKLNISKLYISQPKQLLKHCSS